MSRRSDDELDDLLRDLGDVLDRLTDELDEREREPARDGRDADRVRRGRRARRGRSRRETTGPRPPSPSDVLRFTEEYTIPAVISVLETTIQSLELLRGGLRLADPNRRGWSREDSRATESVGDRVARSVRGGATSALDRTLADLGTALSATELPEDDEARDVLEDARSLTAEIERRLAEFEADDRRDRPDRRDSRRERPSERERDRSSDGVSIEVRDGQRDDARGDRTAGERDGGDEADASDDADADDDAGVDVDVDAELESIRREVGGESDDDGAASDGAGDVDSDAGAGDEGSGDDAGREDDAGDVGASDDREPGDG